MTSWVAPTATICAAVLAALLAYGNNVRLHRLQESLNRVNAQLGEFYGPLFSISEASEAAWQAFRRQVRPGDGYLFATPLDENEAEQWKRWMSAVFMPADRQLYNILVSRSHLLIGDDVPRVFLEFCAHVSCYEVILYNWDQGDYSQLNSVISFPVGFRQQIRNDFLLLKKEQQHLLKRVQKTR